MDRENSEVEMEMQQKEQLNEKGLTAYFDQMATDGRVETTVQWLVEISLLIQSEVEKRLKHDAEHTSDFEQRAKKFRDERNNAWDEFLDLSAQAGYNIKNTLANRSLFMSGYESGKEAMKSQELESLKRKLAQVAI